MTEPERAGERVGAPRPITQVSVVELVIDEVRRLILEGTLPAGAPVSITELSERLQVSHIPVREALRRLEGEGLIELRRSRSAVVAAISADDLRQLFHLRALLEGDIMARAVKVYDADDLAAIAAAWEALERRPDDSVASLAERHVEFHRRINLPAMTDWDLRLGEILWQASDRYTHLILSSEVMTGAPTAFRDTHEGLLRAARSGSMTEARKAVREHLDRGVAWGLASLGDRGSQS
jgi:DNA-binding GntR family transcriptional regulator